jgi:hypothetical protein
MDAAQFKKVYAEVAVTLKKKQNILLKMAN